MTKKVIHRTQINLKDWVLKTKKAMKEEYPEICGEPENSSYCRQQKCENCMAFFNFCCKMNSSYLEDEYENLNIPLDNVVIAFADLGLWSGRKDGYKILGANVNQIFKISEDENEYYADGRNIRADCIHHDGTNYILYRKLKSGISIDRIEKILYDNKYKLSPQQISTYTDSLLPYVKKVYGWK